MKKLALLSLPILAAGMLVGCSVATAANGSAGGSGNNTITSQNIVEGNVDTHQLYAFEAATSIGFLGELGTSTSIAGIAPRGLAADATLLSQLESYLPSVESALLGDDILLSMTTETSDLSDYQTKITVSYSDITLANETFTMYFNETIIQDDDWDDDDEQEEESRIEGIVLVGDATYPIWGEKEIEGNESEVKFVYQLSDTTFVQVEQEKEANEQEFTYTVKEAGVTTYSYSLEVEDDEVELKVKDKAALSSLTMKFDLHKENGDTYIRAKVNNSGTTSTVLFKKVVDATTGEVSYEVISNQ